MENDCYRAQIQAIQTKCEEQAKELEKAKTDNETLENKGKDLQEKVNEYHKEVESLKTLLLEADARTEKLSLELRETIDQRDNHLRKVDHLEAEIVILSKNLNDTEIYLSNYKDAAEDKNKKQLEIIEVKSNELEHKTSEHLQAINQLEKVKKKSEKLQKQLEAVNRKMQQEREENKIMRAHWEAEMKAKDESLSKEMSKFLQARTESDHEKSALQKKIDELETRITNIIKEASEIPRHVTAELTPQRAQVEAQPLKRVDSLLDGMFQYSSERSVDYLDSAKVQQHFAMFLHGEPAPANSLAALKRDNPDSLVAGARTQRPRTNSPVLNVTKPNSPVKEHRYFAMFAREEPEPANSQAAFKRDNPDSLVAGTRTQRPRTYPPVPVQKEPKPVAPKERRFFKTRKTSVKKN
ncbi:GRIP and coiled-coil domain-containing protein-like isoform X2 [Bicyclus anynana]|uniref:GRIP and coiled-coil domain-containing protein-like isoform X2 n=1 Tax=Bicyclus anynana TaxID=110368 RepID=A0ABM3LP18_BICAN|nr:GRIP and coiled-coil domain-containing protein-like isoform X2 [Bicyclus anynana]